MRGGFDVLLSPIPHGIRIKLQEQEFFAARDSRIALADSKAARSRLLKELPEANIALYNEYIEALCGVCLRHLLSPQWSLSPGRRRYQYLAYAVFAELGARNMRPDGRAGMILPRVSQRMTLRNSSLDRW